MENLKRKPITSSPPYETITVTTIDGHLIELSAGDILLCSGNGRLSGGIQKYQEIALRLGVLRVNDLGLNWAVTLSLSHVAAISGGRMVAEATTVNKWAIGPDGKPKRGYQLNPFERWIENYDGRVWVRKLFTPGVGWAFDYMTELTMQDEAIVGTRYENGIPGCSELFFCAFDFLRGPAVKRLQTVSIHCTEGRGNIMQNCDMLSRKVRTNKLPPCMWGTGGKVDQNMINGFMLGPMVALK